MADPLLDKDMLDEALQLVTEEATRYLAQLDGAPVRPPAAEPGGPAGISLPDEGVGSLAAMPTFTERAKRWTVEATSPPKTEAAAASGSVWKG